MDPIVLIHGYSAESKQTTPAAIQKIYGTSTGFPASDSGSASGNCRSKRDEIASLSHLEFFCQKVDGKRFNNASVKELAPSRGKQ
jgi:hypothetical protein